MNDSTKVELRASLSVLGTAYGLWQAFVWFVPFFVIGKNEMWAVPMVLFIGYVPFPASLLSFWRPRGAGMILLSAAVSATLIALAFARMTLSEFAFLAIRYTFPLAALGAAFILLTPARDSTHAESRSDEHRR